MKVTAIIPAKGNSRRLPDKNMQPFGGSTLVGHKIEQLKACSRIDDIVVATNSDEIAAESVAHGASVRMQDDLHCDEDKMPLRDRWQNIVARVETDIVVWAHCTNPLCLPDLYDAAVDAYLNAGDRYDSLCSVTKKQGHAWKPLFGIDNPAPANFDPWGNRHPFASELEPTYYQNGAIFIQPHRQMLENGYFYGYKPLLFEIEQPYDIDIDTQRDLDIARFIYDGMSASQTVYRAADGFRGTVTLDGVEIDASACSPDAGWVETAGPSAVRKYGRVEFKPEVQRC